MTRPTDTHATPGFEYEPSTTPANFTIRDGSLVGFTDTVTVIIRHLDQQEAEHGWQTTLRKLFGMTAPQPHVVSELRDVDFDSVRIASEIRGTDRIAAKEVLDTNPFDLLHVEVSRKPAELPKANAELVRETRSALDGLERARRTVPASASFSRLGRR